MDEVRERFQNLHEIVAAARTKLNRNVWDYLIGGAETETTVRRNRLALDSLALRPRILRNVGTTDTSGTFLGRKLKMPVALAPIGSIERFDPAATAAKTRARPAAKIDAWAHRAECWHGPGQAPESRSHGTPGRRPENRR